jgi:hypothetical protein
MGAIREKTRSHKTGYPFYFSLACGGDGTEWQVGHSKNLEHEGHISQPPRHTTTLTDDTVDVVRWMKSVGIHSIPICEFIRGRYGISILPIDVKAVIVTIDSDSTLQDTEKLEAEALEYGERVNFFTMESELSSVRVEFYTDRGRTRQYL